MTASSVTGVGHGASDKISTPELAIIANGPAVYVAGYVESESSMTSPPSSGNEVVFPIALPGAASHYVVMLTTQNSGTVYVNNLNEDDNGNFSGFTFISESDGTVMYLVSKVGFRSTYPN